MCSSKCIFHGWTIVTISLQCYSVCHTFSEVTFMILVLLKIIGQLFGRISVSWGLYAVSSWLDSGYVTLAVILGNCSVRLFLLHPIRRLMILIWITAGGLQSNYLIKDMSIKIFQWKIILFPFAKKILIGWSDRRILGNCYFFKKKLIVYSFTFE